MDKEGRRLTRGNRGFAYRYPNFFVLSGVTLCLCILYSKPLYDIFFAKPEVKPEAAISGQSKVISN